MEQNRSTAVYVRRFCLPAAYSLLPKRMNAAEASALLLAIGFQESAFAHRRQVKGPARGFFQFERVGVAGVREHPRTKLMASQAIVALRYPSTLSHADAQAIIEHNDVLAAVFARLALWPLRAALPTREQSDEGWRQYLRAWRPGKPKAHTWPENFARAWALVGENDAI